ncbi:MAG: alpha/beta hydrolase fold domain-containing protein, partial [Planctomycetaceae bacterium]
MRRLAVCSAVIPLFLAAVGEAAEVRATRHVYGKDAPAAQVLDAHLLNGDKPSPLLVYIVSGGWRSDPPRETAPGPFQPYHDMGLSAVAVCHRTIDAQVAWPAPADDVARAIQFIRLHAEEWNIDPQRIAVTGRSSGGHVAMMVGFGEDRADPASDEPVCRQSSAVRCVIEQGGPADLSVHIQEMLAADHIPADRKDYLRSRLQALLGVSEGDALSDDSLRRLQALSPLGLINRNTVPLLMLYTGPEGITSIDDPRLQ